MLVPAMLYKEQIIQNFRERYYSDDMMFYTGTLSDYLPNIQDEAEGGRRQYAIVNSQGQLLGYFGYYINWYNECAYGFGVMSFSKGNPIIGRDVLKELNKLIYEYKLHRIEWRMIGGNPIEKSYDKICQKFNGTKHILTDVIKDNCGKYHNDIIYEILRNKEFKK